MAEAKRDSNYTPTLLAWDDINNTTKRLLVDPATGRLLILISNNTPPTAGDRSRKIDQNRVWVAAAVTDNASAVIEPLKTDTSNNLTIDVTV